MTDTIEFENILLKQNDFEVLSIVLMILGIVVSILIAYKEVTAPAKETVTF